MKFDAIDLLDGGNISYSLQRWVSKKKPYLSIVHAAFSGDYRSGCSGAPDARYIEGIVRTADAVWNPGGLILDLRNLRYEWGDEMELVLSPLKKVTAIIVSPKCERAISTLIYGLHTRQTILEEENFHDELESALDYIKQAMVADWNSTIERCPEWFKKTDLITAEDLK